MTTQQNGRLPNFNIAIPTVFNADESINLAATIAIVEKYAQQSIPAVLICGSTGEQHSLKLAEKIALLNAVETSGVSARISTIFGVSAIWQREALELASEISKSPIAAVMLGFPPYIKPTQQQALAYAHHIIEASNKPVILYNNPQRTGFDLSVDSVLELARYPQVIGLKDTGEISRIALLKPELPSDFLYFIGGESELQLRFSAGFNALSSVAGNLFPREVQSILDLYLAGHTHQAQQQIIQLKSLIEPHSQHGLLLGIKKELTQRGIFAGVCRSPLV